MEFVTRPNGPEGKGISEAAFNAAWRADIQDRLEILSAKDKELAVSFAVRQSLKVFPLLALNGGFDYWTPPNRCQRLLGIYRGFGFSLRYLLGKDEFASAIARVASTAINAVDDETRLDPAFDIDLAILDAFDGEGGKAAAKVFLDEARRLDVLANGAAEAADASDSARASGAASAAASARFSLHAAISAITASDTNGVLLAVASALAASDLLDLSAIEFELRQLETGLALSDYFSKPLWQESTPESDSILRIWESSFKPAVDALIQAQDAYSTTVAALERMIQDYELLLHGRAPEIKPTAAQLFESTRIRKDELGRDALVRSLAELITHRGNNEHSTIGLLGDWGVGKTGVLDLLRTNLQTSTDCDVVFGEFNAWSYEHCGNLQAGIAHEAISALSSPFLGTEKKWIAAKAWKGVADSWNRSVLVLRFAWKLHRKRILWLSLPILSGLGSAVWGAVLLGKSAEAGAIPQPLPVVGVAGGLVVLSGLWKQVKVVLSQACTKELRTYLNLPSYQKDLGTIPVMRKQIQALCEVRLGRACVLAPPAKKERRFVFVIDDLDRCDPEGIVRTFEAVRLVMDIPRVTVLIAVDQRIALAALALHYKDLAQYRNGESPLCIARDYLAKMIHLPIRITEPDEASTRAFLQSQWSMSGEPENRSLSWFVGHLQVKAPRVPQADAPPVAESSVSSESDSRIEATAVTRDLGEDDLAQSILDHPLEELLPRQDDFGLSVDQKACYYWWSKEFHLRNPRQMKRILNSYNLLRLLLRKRPEGGGASDDRKVSEMDVGGGTAVPVFPALLALVLLEHLNDLPNAERRETLRNELLTNSTSEKWCHHELMFLAHGAEALGLHDSTEDWKAAAQALLAFVEPFVLPALEKGVGFVGSKAETGVSAGGVNP